MTDRLFAYGTLRRDVRNSKFERLLAGEARLVGRGRMRGRLFDLGRYPGFVVGPNDEEEPWVRGELFRLDTPQETLARLDEYEGCGVDDPKPHPYDRVERDVVLDQGETVSAWVYVYRRHVDPTREIHSGDYATWAGA